MFLNIVAAAAELMNRELEYDVGGFESHHQQKADCPSGTAKAVAQVLLNHLERKKSIVYELGNRKRKDDELHFSSLRCGSNPGTHTVAFDSPADSITLTHQAKNREGFANGAVKAAEWIAGKKGLFTFEEMVNGNGE